MTSRTAGCPAAPGRTLAPPGRRRAAAAALVVLGLLTAACGGSGSGRSASSSPRTSSAIAVDSGSSSVDSSSAGDSSATATDPPSSDPSSTTSASTGGPGPSTSVPSLPPPTTPQPAATPMQQAVQSRLLDGDLPAGFTAGPATGLFSGLLGCLGGVAGADAPVAQVDGDHWSLGAPDQQVQALSTTAVYPDADVAKRVLDGASTAQFGQCASRVVAFFGQLVDPAYEPLSLVAGLPARGEQSVWFRGALTSADPTGGDTRQKVDALISPIRTGRTVSFLVLVSIGSRVDQWMIDDLSLALADRQR